MENKGKKSLVDVAAIRGNTPEKRDGDGAVKVRQTEFPLRKPGQRLFFRTHPDPQYHLSGVPVLEDEERRLFFVQVGYVPPEEALRFVQYIHIVTCITLRGSVFLWPIKGTSNDWSTSALRVVKEAQENCKRTPTVVSRTALIVASTMTLCLGMTRDSPRCIGAWPGLKA
jgi:hypothetical protein